MTAGPVMQIAVFTAGAALVATLLMIVPGLAIAWVLARGRFRGKALVETLVSLPLVVPPVATGLLLLWVFGRRGPVGRLLDAIGAEGLLRPCMYYWPWR